MSMSDGRVMLLLMLLLLLLLHVLHLRLLRLQAIELLHQLLQRRIGVVLRHRHAQLRAQTRQVGVRRGEERH